MYVMVNFQIPTKIQLGTEISFIAILAISKEVLAEKIHSGSLGYNEAFLPPYK